MVPEAPEGKEKIMKILTVVGARPQFIKAATVSRQIKKNDAIQEVIIHTGQHFDANMSAVFFQQMDISKPDYNLGINSLNHGAMTGRMVAEIEAILLKEKADWVLVYGDTNSTLAGAMAAAKLHINTAHVEAGLRSFNNLMPEEINRILTDKISNLLFCPTVTAVENLKKENIVNSAEVSVVNCGDVMYDAALYYRDRGHKPVFKLPDKFILATIHRAENTDNIERLRSIISALNKISENIRVIAPLHPRTCNILKQHKIRADFKIINPVGYLEMIHLLQNCSFVMTDSGGLQKEAYFFQKFCLILRDETEWVELVANGYAIMAGTVYKNILQAFADVQKLNSDFNRKLYGDGNAAEKIISELQKFQ